MSMEYDNTEEFVGSNMKELGNLMSGVITRRPAWMPISLFPVNYTAHAKETMPNAIGHIVPISYYLRPKG